MLDFSKFQHHNETKIKNINRMVNGIVEFKKLIIPFKSELFQFFKSEEISILLEYHKDETSNINFRCFGIEYLLIYQTKFRIRKTDFGSSRDYFEKITLYKIDFPVVREDISFFHNGTRGSMWKKESKIILEMEMDKHGNINQELRPEDAFVEIYEKLMEQNAA